MAVLFEYNNWVPIDNKDALVKMLKDIWQSGVFDNTEIVTEEAALDYRYQPFLRIDGNQARANNYVGFIQNKDEVLEIYPKVFHDIDLAEKQMMLRHIFFWFSYCRKWRFPFNKVNLGLAEIDSFPELMINLMGTQILNVVSTQPFFTYQNTEEALLFPKGSINFKRYLATSLSKGKFHQLECDYEPHVFDNQVNRVIKFCSKLLMEKTTFSENLVLLQDILSILDDVEDVSFTINDLRSISMNSFFVDYGFVMETCEMILSQQLYSGHNYDLSQWCLLFPMEYIFEDFVAGFLSERFQSEWIVEYQKSDRFLSDFPKVFRMQHDIYLTRKRDGKKMILDTKYKLRELSYKLDPKKGIAQTDLYQMVSYAYKRGCADVILIYPNVAATIQESDTFEIYSGFNNIQKIKVTAIEIPFWSIYDYPNIESNLFATLFSALSKLD